MSTICLIAAELGHLLLLLLLLYSTILLQPLMLSCVVVVLRVGGPQILAQRRFIPLSSLHTAASTDAQ